MCMTHERDWGVSDEVTETEVTETGVVHERRALPFQRGGAGRRHTDPHPPESLWTFSDKLDPDQLPSSLAPERMAEPELRPRTHHRVIEGVVLGAVLLVATLTSLVVAMAYESDRHEAARITESAPVRVVGDLASR